MSTMDSSSMFSSLSMDSDFFAIGIFAFAFAVAGIVVYIVSVFGAKEQSYEEALQEQKRKLEAERREQKKNHAAKKAEMKAAKGGGKADQGQEKARKARRPQEQQQQQEVAPEGGSSSKVKAGRKSKANKKGREEPSQSHEEQPVPQEFHQEYLQASEPEVAVAEPEPVVAAAPAEPEPEPEKMAVEEELQVQIQEAPQKSKKKAKQQQLQNGHNEQVSAAPVAAAEPAVAAPDPVEEVVPIRSNKSKQQSAPAAPAAHSAPLAAAKMTARALIAAVKKTPLNDHDAQQLIDILLNKQSGGADVNGISEWKDSGSGGGRSGGGGAVQKELAAKTAALADQDAAVKSLTDRLNVLRTELNSSKAASNKAQRLIEEERARHQHETDNINTRLKSEADGRAMYASQLQSHVTQIQQLQTALANANAAAAAAQAQATAAVPIQPQQQQQPDQAMVAELERLAAAKANLEGEVADMHAVKAAGEKEMAEAVARAESVRAKESAESQEKFRALEKTSDDTKFRLKQVEEENERLSEQLAENVERPRAEGQEESPGTKASPVAQNGVHGKGEGEEGGAAAAKARKEAAEWEKKFQVIKQEKEAMAQDSDAKVASLQSEMGSFEAKIRQIQSELEVQREKNDNLSSSATSAVSEARLASERCQRDLMKRLFPDVRAATADKEDVVDHEKWFEGFAAAVMKANDAKSTDGGNEESKEDVERLEKQVQHYKDVLSQTEAILTKLQSGVEAEEGVWKQRLADKEAEMADKCSALEARNAALEESLTVVGQAEQMQEKLKELESKLGEEEAAVKKLEAGGARHAEEKKKLGEELETVKSDLATERSKSTELGSQVAKMNQIISASQEALQQEQKTVELLKEAKGESPENGPSKAAAAANANNEREAN